MDSQKNTTVFGFAFPNGNVPTLPDWVLDPDSDHAAADCERDLVAIGTHTYMDRFGITKERAEELNEAEQRRIMANGMSLALRTLSGGTDAMDRATYSLAHKANKHEIYTYVDEETQDFESFLQERMTRAKSRGTISETKFMLDLLRMYEKRGQRKFVEQLFQNRDGFAKFTKGIPELRKTFKSVAAAEFQFQSSEERLKVELAKAETKEERRELMGKYDELKEQESETLDALNATLDAKLKATVQLSRDPNIDVDEVGAILRTVTADKPDGDFEKRPKMKVDKITFKGGAHYIITVKEEGEGMVERAISDFADVINRDPAIVVEKFRKYLA